MNLPNAISQKTYLTLLESCFFRGKRPPAARRSIRWRQKWAGQTQPKFRRVAARCLFCGRGSRMIRWRDKRRGGTQKWLSWRRETRDSRVPGWGSCWAIEHSNCWGRAAALRCWWWRGGEGMLNRLPRKKRECRKRDWYGRLWVHRLPLSTNLFGPSVWIFQLACNFRRSATKTEEQRSANEERKIQCHVKLNVTRETSVNTSPTHIVLIELEQLVRAITD